MAFGSLATLCMRTDRRYHADVRAGGWLEAGARVVVNCRAPRPGKLDPVSMQVTCKGILC